MPGANHQPEIRPSTLAALNDGWRSDNTASPNTNPPTASIVFWWALALLGWESSSTVSNAEKTATATQIEGCEGASLAAIGEPSPAISRVSSAVFGLLAFHTLAELITVYMWLRIATTVLTVLSAWRLRQTSPDLARPFRIPWGRAGLFYVVVAPLIMSAVALLGSDRFALRWGPVAILLGPLAYLLAGKRRPTTA